MFDLMSQHRTVYAIDLPGYGTSERSDRLYTPYGQKIHLAHFQIKTALLTVTAANPAPSCSNHRRQPQCMVMTTQTPWPSLSPLALGVF